MGTAEMLGMPRLRDGTIGYPALPFRDACITVAISDIPPSRRRMGTYYTLSDSHTLRRVRLCPWKPLGTLEYPSNPPGAADVVPVGSVRAVVAGLAVLISSGISS